MRLGRKTPAEKYGAFCYRCAGPMALGRKEVSHGYDPQTGQRVSSYWQTWVCTRCSRIGRTLDFVYQEPEAGL